MQLEQGAWHISHHRTINQSVHMQALGQVRAAQKALAGLCVAAFLGLVAFLGSRGCPLLSLGPVSCVATFAAAAAALLSLRRLESQFVYTDWVNAEK